jgi:hypothetical protein
MSVTRHQIFKIDISRDANLEIDKVANDKINDFLAIPNNIYINHSICVLTESVEEYGSIKSVNRFVIISLVYEDLDGTTMDLSNASPVIKQVVKRETKAASKIPKPDIETDFDKVMSGLKSDDSSKSIVINHFSRIFIGEEKGEVDSTQNNK